MITALHHVSVIVSDTEQALKFYRDMLGLKVDPARPDLGYAGAWLDIGNQQIHLLELPNPDPLTGRPEHGGRDRHVALLVSSLDEIVKTLEQNNITFTLSKSGRRALFCRDPDGNGVELIEGNQ
ncbi:MAG: VOC family protein [Gammaproteobacteria bacterium]|nr:VOC family protein [Gammaproteobacteria bacterium]